MKCGPRSGELNNVRRECNCDVWIIIFLATCICLEEKSFLDHSLKLKVLMFIFHDSVGNHVMQNNLSLVWPWGWILFTKSDFRSVHFPLICIDQGVSESSSLLFTKIIFKIHALGLFFSLCIFGSQPWILPVSVISLLISIAHKIAFLSLVSK